jgi:hypothetical protein
VTGIVFDLDTQGLLIKKENTASLRESLWQYKETSRARMTARAFSSFSLKSSKLTPSRKPSALPAY